MSALENWTLPSFTQLHFIQCRANEPGQGCKSGLLQWWPHSAEINHVSTKSKKAKVQTWKHPKTNWIRQLQAYAVGSESAPCQNKWNLPMSQQKNNHPCWLFNSPEMKQVTSYIKFIFNKNNNLSQTGSFGPFCTCILTFLLLFA